MKITSSNLKHYEKETCEEIKARLQRFYLLLMDAIKNDNLYPLKNYLREIVQERYSAGFAIFEVATAITILEKIISQAIIKEIPPERLAESLVKVCTILGACKLWLGSSFLSLASNGEVSYPFKSTVNGLI